MDAILARAPKCRRAAVIGGGLLGLEAAKALMDLGGLISSFTSRIYIYIDLEPI